MKNVSRNSRSVTFAGICYFALGVCITFESLYSTIHFVLGKFTYLSMHDAILIGFDFVKLITGVILMIKPKAIIISFAYMLVWTMKSYPFKYNEFVLKLGLEEPEE